MFLSHQIQFFEFRLFIKWKSWENGIYIKFSFEKMSHTSEMYFLLFELWNKCTKRNMSFYGDLKAFKFHRQGWIRLDCFTDFTIFRNHCTMLLFGEQCALCIRAVVDCIRKTLRSFQVIHVIYNRFTKFSVQFL